MFFVVTDSFDKWTWQFIWISSRNVFCFPDFNWQSSNPIHTVFIFQFNSSNSLISRLTNTYRSKLLQGVPHRFCYAELMSTLDIMSQLNLYLSQKSLWPNLSWFQTDTSKVLLIKSFSATLYLIVSFHFGLTVFCLCIVFFLLDFDLSGRR